MDVFVTQAMGIVGSAATAALIAIGLAISFRLMGIINFAHGAFIMMGAYAVVLSQSDWGLPWAAAVVFAVAVGLAAGAVVERGLVRRLYGSPALSILGTLGLAIVLRQGAQLWLGNGYRPTHNPLPGPMSVLGVPYAKYNLALIAIAVVVLVAVIAALHLTPLGVRVRAVAADRPLAESLGVHATRLNLLVFAASSGLAALAGALVAPVSTVSPTMGQPYLFTAFIVVIVGGSRIWGVLAAALVVAAAQNLVTYWLNSVLAFLVVLALAFLALQWFRRVQVRAIV